MSRELVKKTILEGKILSQLDSYVALLEKWQKVQNLISPTTLDEIWARHILDSLQLLPHLNGKTAVDLGTGAGLPGLVLAIARPDMHFHLVESNQRKCAFLQEAARQTGAKVTIHPIRAEEFTQTTDIVMARAMTQLATLLDFAKPSVDKGGYALFPKGKTHQEELTLAAKSFMFDYEIIKVNAKMVSRETTLLHQPTSQSIILKVTKIERR